MTSERRHCGRCHHCGGRLRLVLDGEQWCSACQTYRRYRSHGWGASGVASPCPIVGRGWFATLVTPEGERVMLANVGRRSDLYRETVELGHRVTQALRLEAEARMFGEVPPALVA